MRVIWKRVLLAWRCPYVQSMRPLPDTVHVFGPIVVFVCGGIANDTFPVSNQAIAGCVTSAGSRYQKFIQNSRSCGFVLVLMAWKLTVIGVFGSIGMPTFLSSGAMTPFTG